MSDSSRETMVARIGTTLAEKYKLTRLLGAGGMGAVYEAVNAWTERRSRICTRFGVGTDGSYGQRSIATRPHVAYRIADG